VDIIITHLAIHHEFLGGECSILRVEIAHCGVVTSGERGGAQKTCEEQAVKKDSFHITKGSGD
jgi:hypothetical protein